MTLAKTTATGEVEYKVGDWSFRGRLSNKIWREAYVDGIAYTYSPKEIASTSVHKGEFAKIGKNVRVRTMRAYLYYTGSAEKPLGAKSFSGASFMSAAENVEESLPESIPVRFVHKDIVVIEDPADNEIASVDGNDDDITSIAKKIAVPVIKSNRWFDLKGRRLNGKPATRGIYLNNKTPVVVK